jgi:hypothetical protein
MIKLVMIKLIVVDEDNDPIDYMYMHGGHSISESL